MQIVPFLALYGFSGVKRFRVWSVSLITLKSSFADQKSQGWQYWKDSTAEQNEASWTGSVSGRYESAFKHLYYGLRLQCKFIHEKVKRENPWKPSMFEREPWKIGTFLFFWVMTTFFYNVIVFIQELFIFLEKNDLDVLTFCRVPPPAPLSPNRCSVIRRTLKTWKRMKMWVILCFNICQDQDWSNKCLPESL